MGKKSEAKTNVLQPLRRIGEWFELDTGPAKLSAIVYPGDDSPPFAHFEVPGVEGQRRVPLSEIGKKVDPPAGAKADAPENPKRGRPKKFRFKQAKLPGMDQPEDPELEKEVDEYVDVRDERMGLTKREKELNNKLLERLRAMGRTELRVEGHIVQIVAKDERVKVRKAKAKDEDGGEEDDDEDGEKE